jgi:hypothetical protein
LFLLIKKIIIPIILLILPFSLFVPALVNAGYNDSPPTGGLEPPTQVLAGVRIINLEKVEPASNTYTMDFYIWFTFDPGRVDIATVEAFEFLNGAPTIYQTTRDISGFIQYRVHGTFLTNFDCRNYPFDSYELPVTIEHKFLNATYLVYTSDPDSSMDPSINFVGWGSSNFNTSVHNHKLTDQVFSDYKFSIEVSRPIVNSFIKYVLPIFVITLISLSTFFLKPKQFGERVAITVTTLISASATHINILNGLPPTPYLTIADKIYLSVYVVFLANLVVSIYVMRLVDQSKLEEAAKFNDKAFKVLLIMSVVLLAVQFLI